jgi:hypothetical protein
MDKSNLYLKKCTNAEEIQKNWELKDGDYFIAVKSAPILSKVCILNDWETRNHVIENRSIFIWIPGLDQLQNMIDWTQWEFRITKRSKFEMHYASNSEQLSSTVTGESMEQIWLAFVMKEKYGKIWNKKNETWTIA